MGGPRHAPQSNSWALPHHCKILYPKSRSVLSRQNGLRDILGILIEPERTDVHLLEAGLHKAAAGIHVVVGQLLLHLANTQSVRDEFVRVDANLILSRSAPEIRHVDDIRYGLEFLQQDPVFNRSQIHQVIPRISASEGVPINLTDQPPVRTDLRLQPLRQIDLGEPLEDLLPVPVVVRLVVEDAQHKGQTEN